MNYINGVAYEGNSVVVTGGRIYVDGKEVTKDIEVTNRILTVKVEGTLENLITDASVQAEGLGSEPFYQYEVERIDE